MADHLWNVESRTEMRSPKSKLTTYTCRQCQTTEQWPDLPPLWVLCLCEGAAHSDHGFTFYFCGEDCLGAYWVKAMLNRVPE